MKDQLNRRLDQLNIEYRDGMKMKNKYISELEELNKTLLRIEGAVQVLREELNVTEEPSDVE